MNLWLKATAGPPSKDVRGRVRFWEEREEAVRRFGPVHLLEPGPGLPRAPQAHGRLETYLPMGTLRRDVHGLIHHWFKPETSLQGIPLYLSYVAIFLGVVVLLSLIAHFVQRLIKKSGLSFYDRIGGGFLGMATGTCVMIAFLGMLYMFIPEDWGIVQAAHESKSMQFTQKTLRVLGNAVPRPMQQVFGVDDGDPHGAEDKKKKPRTDLNQKVPATPKKKRKRGL